MTLFNMKNTALKRATAMLLAVFFAGTSIESPRSNNPVCLAPATRVETPVSSLFLNFSEEVVPDALVSSLEAPSTQKKVPFDLTSGEEKTRRLIVRTQENPGSDFSSVYIDFNNLKLRNWVYTSEIMDVLIADLDHALVTAAERVVGKVGAEEFRGFCYKKGGDERMVILPTKNPREVQRFLSDMKSFLRRRLLYKYKVAVLQLDDDSRIVTQGKENKKDDRTRRFLFTGGMLQPERPSSSNRGILDYLGSARGVHKIIPHAEQYYLIYDDEEQLESTFLELQRRYPRNNIDFKPHLYAGGFMDAFSVTASATRLSDTFADINGSVSAGQLKNPAFLLQQMGLRAEMGAQLLNEKGKDRWAVLSPEARILTLKRQQARERVHVFQDEESLTQLSQRPGDWEKGQEDPRFRRLPGKKTAVEVRLSAVKNPGFLVRVDIGYMNEVLKKGILSFEEDIIREAKSKNPDVTPEELLKEVEQAWFNHFRMSSPRQLGSNTKFLNEVYHHGGTDDIISAILLAMWEAVSLLNKENFETENVWDGNIHFFRGPPDSLFFWFPRRTDTALSEPELVAHLKKQMDVLLKNLRDMMRETTLDPISLNFIVSAQSVKEDLIPYGNVKKAWDLLENMDRIYRVFLATVIKDDPLAVEQVWNREGGVEEGTPKEILDKIKRAVETSTKTKMQEIDPEYAEARYASLSEDRFFNEGTHMLVYNGNVETRSERVKIDLAVNSQVEISRRFLIEKAQKWSAELEEARRTGKPNLDELLYILSAMRAREAELFRFEDAADALELVRRDPASLFNAIRERREMVNEMIYFLTGLYFDPQKGVIAPEKDKQIPIRHAYELFGKTKSFYHVSDGALKVEEVLADPEKTAVWKKYRREQRKWLRFTRLEPLFIRMMWAYEEILTSYPLPNVLAQELGENLEMRRVFQNLDAVLRGEKIVPHNSVSAAEFLSLKAWWQRTFPQAVSAAVDPMQCLCHEDAVVGWSI